MLALWKWSPYDRLTRCPILNVTEGKRSVLLQMYVWSAY